MAKSLSSPAFSLQTDPAVDLVFQQYPTHVQPKMQALRKLVIQTAKETDGVLALEETLKWGEPSYLTKNGSTIRMDWKARSPEQYALYFKCTSLLVESFAMVYPEKLSFEGKRAIVFSLDDPLPSKWLIPCIRAALTYHKVKKLPLLGLLDAFELP